MVGNIRPTRESYFLLDLSEKGNEVANLIDTFMMEKRIERPLLSRGNTVPSLAEDLGVYCWLSHNPKQTATTWSGRDEGEHVRPGGPRAVAEASLLRNAWLGEVTLEAPDPLPWLRGASFETRTPVPDFMSRLKGAAL